MLKSVIWLLTFLYFIQGIPYGFQSRFLPVYLRKHGQSLTSLSLYKLLLIPWLCKALWAPLVDKYGTQRSWLLGSVCALAIASVICALITPEYMTTLSTLLFCMNIFAATQDISVDRMALSLLNDDELGVGNTAQVVGYKCGALFGGGVLLWFIETAGWTTLFTLISTIYTLAALFIMISSKIREIPQNREYSDHTGEKPLVDLGYWNILMTVFSSPWTKWMMGYLLIYKLAEQGALSMLPLYLVDGGMSLSDIALWTGMLGQAVSITGSTLSGFIMSMARTEAYVLIQRLFMVQFIPLLILAVITRSQSLNTTVFNIRYPYQQTMVHSSASYDFCSSRKLWF